MLFRFSLYGFLKNQRYFEPFLILVFLEKGMSFFQIGLLIAFREISVNVLEIPSGAVADLWGRRKSMILSFSAYIVSFLVFGLAQQIGLLFVAMLFFAVGEAFRTGTHKTMIFTWLRLRDRADERTRVYGYTRSWSKYGSALSVVLAAIFVYIGDSYTYIFYFTIVPYLLGIVNFLGYPRELDGGGEKETSLPQVLRHLRESFKEGISHTHLRRLIMESMGFQGVYETAKDYLQPVLKTAALATAAHWVVTSEMSDIQQATLLIGPVYFLLYLLSGLASRYAYRVADMAGGEEQGACWMWGAGALIFIGLGVAAFYQLYAALIAAFILLDTLQNLWRPVHLGRFDAHTREAQGATVLSIESQARHVTTMVVAPLLGLAVDMVHTQSAGGTFWPVGVLGSVVFLSFFLVMFRNVKRMPDLDHATGTAPMP